MKERKLFKALQCLDVHELAAFRKFLQSPFFNVNEDLTHTFEYVEQKFKTGADIHAISNEDLWSVVRSHQPYDDQKMRKLLSDLLVLLESFLAHAEFARKPALQLSMKLEAARKKNMDSLYSGLLSDVKRLHRTELNQSADFYIHKYLIERNLFNLTSENEKKTSKSELEQELNINEISRNLDYFYVAEKLKYYCTLLSWKKMYKIEQQIDNMDFAINSSQRDPYANIPPIAMYKKIYDTFDDRDQEKHYYELKHLIEQYIHLFPPEETREIYYTAISYCIEKFNKGNREFEKETFYLYKDSLEREILLVNSQLSTSDYRNISAAALRVGEYQWAEYFIQSYAKFIEEKHRDNAVYFSMARLDFYRKNYRKVIEHLSRVNYEDVWYSLGSRTILIFTYYELDEFDALESLLQAFRMYIDREKSLSKDRKQSYLNLIKMTKSLIKINPNEKDKLLKLKQEIDSMNNIVSKPWLLEKVDELL